MNVDILFIGSLVAAILIGRGSTPPPSSTPEIAGKQQSANTPQLSGGEGDGTPQPADASRLDGGTPPDDSLQFDGTPGIAPPTPPVKKIAITIDCAGGTPVDCSVKCTLAGMACLPSVNHPYRPTAGSGTLSACSNDGPGPFYTCAYQFSDGDVCVRAKPFGLPPWTCTGPAPEPNANENKAL